MHWKQFATQWLYSWRLQKIYLRLSKFREMKELDSWHIIDCNNDWNKRALESYSVNIFNCKRNQFAIYRNEYQFRNASRCNLSQIVQIELALKCFTQMGAPTLLTQESKNYHFPLNDEQLRLNFPSHQTRLPRPHVLYKSYLNFWWML